MTNDLVRAIQFHDGAHKYLIPEPLYNLHKDLLTNFDEDDDTQCSLFDELFGKYRVDGTGPEIYIKLI